MLKESLLQNSSNISKKNIMRQAMGEAISTPVITTLYKNLERLFLYNTHRRQCTVIPTCK